MIYMADEDPTNEELQKRIEILEAELDEIQGKLEQVLKIEKACYDMGQKLADKFKDPLADWWWPV